MVTPAFNTRMQLPTPSSKDSPSFLKHEKWASVDTSPLKNLYISPCHNDVRISVQQCNRDNIYLGSKRQKFFKAGLQPPGKTSSMQQPPWKQGNLDKEDDISRHRNIWKNEDLIMRKKIESEKDKEDTVSMHRNAARFQKDGEARRERNKNEIEKLSMKEERGGSAISRIADRLRSLGNKNNTLNQNAVQSPQKLSQTAGWVYIPRATQPLFPALDKSWSTPDHLVPDPGVSERIEIKFPWDQDPNDIDFVGEDPDEKKKVKPPSLAELILPDTELKRLITLGLKMHERLKIGRRGVTDGILQGIHERWQHCEIVKVKLDGPLSLNMKKTQDELEKKTGGLVVWKAGSAAIIYRGKDYCGPPAQLLNMSEAEKGKDKQKTLSSSLEAEDMKRELSSKLGKYDLEVVPPESEYEREMDALLEELGPRYEDWTGAKPIPVDADMLPPIIENFRSPFRLLPYGINPKLTNIELTNIRRVTRPLPPHFVLGRNRGLQGLANAIMKLWEKSEVVKIAVKRGMQNINNEIMAEELKLLTGGVLLSRDNEFITFYRGKDFLPSSIAAALQDRESMMLVHEEEHNRSRTLSRDGGTSAGHDKDASNAVQQAYSEWGKWVETEDDTKTKEKMNKVVRLAKAKAMEKRLAIAVAKKTKAEEELAKVEQLIKRRYPCVDRETISEEERFMYSKLGLKMKPFLLLGRRGVFDGVIENMHLHWKYRELVKIVYKVKNKADMEETAKMLEYESGGILVGIVPSSKGPAIIMYRGKNYQRPAELRPSNLLTKRQALKRSVELQRRESLKRHVLALEKKIGSMEETANEFGNIQEPHLEDIPINDINGEASLNADNKYVLLQQREESQASAFKKAEQHKKCRDILGPVIHAEPLTNKERLVLRKKALAMSKPCHFHVGKSNVVAGLIRSIRLFLRNHSLVKVGIKGRANGTSVAEIVQELEDGTGAILVSQEYNKLILYRGWPDGEERPSYDEELCPNLISAVKEEDNLLDQAYGLSDQYASETDEDITESDDEDYMVSASEVDGVGQDEHDEDSFLYEDELYATDASDNDPFDTGIEDGEDWSQDDESDADGVAGT